MFGLREQEIYALISTKKENENSRSNSPNLDSISSYEQIFLKVLLHYPAFIEKIRDDDIVDMLEDDSVKQILNLCTNSDILDTASIINHLADPESQKIVSQLLLSSKDIESEFVAEQVFEQSYRRIKLKSIKKEQRIIKSRLMNSNNKEPEFEIELLKEYDNLVKMEKSLSEQVYGA